jgi:hypothetical protein
VASSAAGSSGRHGKYIRKQARGCSKHSPSSKQHNVVKIRKSVKIHQHPSGSVKIRQNPSRSVKIRQDPSISIEIRQIHQNPSKSIKTRQNPSKSVKIRQDPSKSDKIRQDPSRTVKERQGASRSVKGAVFEDFRLSFEQELRQAQICPSGTSP